MKISFDVENIEQQHALDLIEKSSCSFFLTGRAGTGKTTFLKLVQELVQKEFLVLAPTGVAAINAGGQTIHSFFGLDTGVQAPGDYGYLNPDKVQVVRTIDTIIIDEVSMVRCDIIDAIDRTLRLYRENSAPFGGVQMVFVGDMFQLEPVVTEADKAILMDLYEAGTFSFFKAGVIRQISLRKIEFVKVYRQTDPLFLGILDRMRIGQTTADDIRTLNAHSLATDHGGKNLQIVLTSTRRDAQTINVGRLSRLSGEAKVYSAIYQGTFTPTTADVAEPELTLKVGAQVMFAKNDSARRWVNGTLGIVRELTDDVVTVETKEGQSYGVERAEWERIEYTYDKATKKCHKEVVGLVSQFPLKLAWAITIHKSQSLTFDNVAVDFGRRTFGCGQAYVALSRSRSLQGLELLRPISLSSVLVSHDALEFARGTNDEEGILREIRIGEAVDSVLREQDFDTAALTLFKMVGDALCEEDYSSACELFSRGMSLLVDDACYEQCYWPVIPCRNHELTAMEAARLFFCGNTDGCIAKLNDLGVAIQSDVDALYLLARCHEQKKEWDEVERDYSQLGDIYSSLTDRGQNPMTFRKIRYRWAILNEREYHDDGIGVMRQLLTENPGYPKYHTALRWMLQNNAEIKSAYKSTVDNLLVESVFDESVSDAAFSAAVIAAWRKRNEVWDGYRKFINSLKLSLAN